MAIGNLYNKQTLKTITVLCTLKMLWDDGFLKCTLSSQQNLHLGFRNEVNKQLHILSLSFCLRFHDILSLGTEGRNRLCSQFVFL